MSPLNLYCIDWVHSFCWVTRSLCSGALSRSNGAGRRMTSHLSAEPSSEMSLRPSQSVTRVAEKNTIRRACSAANCPEKKWRLGRVVMVQNPYLEGRFASFSFHNIPLRLAHQNHVCALWSPLYACLGRVRCSTIVPALWNPASGKDCRRELCVSSPPLALYMLPKRATTCRPFNIYTTPFLILPSPFLPRPSYELLQSPTAGVMQ